MDTLVKRNIRLKLYDFFSKKIVQHGLIWTVMLFVFIFLENTHHSFLFSLAIEITNVFSYAIVVYFNLLYLIPNYLTEKRFLQYCGLLILSVLMITPIKIALLYGLFHYFPEGRASLIVDKNWYFIATFFMVGISTIIKIISDWLLHLREKQELQTQNMQSELRFLKSQINPHFLFNTLNNLYALTLKKSDKAPDIVIKLSEMMRYMLYECNEKSVRLNKEINYIKNYLDLEQLRQGSHADIRFEMKGEVLNQNIAPLLFIPFLENSFKHGLNNSIQDGYVDIKLLVNHKHIHFFIENSKSDSLPARHHRRSGGIGLVNVKRRLNILYPEKYDLDIQEDPRSYTVNLEINLD